MHWMFKEILYRYTPKIVDLSIVVYVISLNRLQVIDKHHYPPHGGEDGEDGTFWHVGLHY
jgi:hypothetical protein